MHQLRFLILTSFIWLSLSGCGEQPNNTAGLQVQSTIDQKVIYGEDDRVDWYQNTNSLYSKLALSTVAVMDTSNIIINDTDHEDDFDFDSVTIKTTNINLCPSEPFAKQKKGAWCSGFLVAPDLIVTAGHCIRSQSSCERTSFVFDFALSSKQSDPAARTTSDVYKCVNLIERVQNNTGADWALLRIDRPAFGRTPLKLRTTGLPEIGEELAVIGHPSGLPSKIADGAFVRKISNGYLVASTDSYGGNSGSAVFNAKTGDVEGILVRGEADYIFENGCRKSNVCKQNSCRGEDITLISELRDLIQNTESPLPQDDDDDDFPGEYDDFYISSLKVKIKDNPSIPAISTIKKVPAIKNPSDLKIRVKIKHAYMRDLSITLVAPNGKKVLLQERRFKFGSKFHETFGETRHPEQDFSILGDQPKGDWTLEVRDHSLFVKGHLLEWELIMP